MIQWPTLCILLLRYRFSKSEIGTIVKFFGLFATLIGAFIGGLLSLKIGLYRSLMIFGIFQAIATLGFSILAYFGNSLYLLMIVISLENLAAGMGYTAYLAFIANMTNKRFTATQLPYDCFDVLAIEHWDVRLFS